MNLLHRSVTSSAYNVVANVIRLAVGFASSIVLARLLDPEVFGVFAFAFSTVKLTIALPNFGFQGAFLHRTGGKAGVTEEVLRVYFTLKLMFSLIWAVLMVVGVTFLASEQTRWVFGVIIGATFIQEQTSVINVLLTQRVKFRRLAVVQAVVAVAQAVVSISLAWFGQGLWALLSTQIVAAILYVVLLYIVRPVWRPRLGWSKDLARYFLNFGSKVFWATLLAQALDRVDDIWTGAVLGDRALGFYDKAFRFATYPRHILSTPITQVVAGTYAQLRDDRSRLSKTFSWVNILMVRMNFWIAALIWLVAPEFIRLALGAKWLPMLEAFRLMLIYTLFDPVKLMIARVLTISGVPERVVRVRAIQLAVMVAGLSVLGPWLGISGVALAVDVMLVVGIGILYAEVRRFVDFSLRRIFGVPILAAGAGMAAVYGALALPGVTGSDWRTGLVKVTVFSCLYAGTVALLERRQIPKLGKIFGQLGMVRSF